jgi:hypothetical protein
MHVYSRSGLDEQTRKDASERPTGCGNPPRDESGISRTRNVLNLKDWDPFLVYLLEESLKSLRRKKSEKRNDKKRKSTPCGGS